MKRLVIFSILAAFCSTAWTADDSAPAEQTPAESKPVDQQLKENPDSAETMNLYMMSQLRQLVPLINSAPDEAEKILGSMRETLGALQPTTDDAKRLLERANEAVDHYELQLQIVRTSLDDLKAKLSENPDDAKTIQALIQKVMQQVGSLVRSEPAKAEEQLAAIQTFLSELAEKIQSDEGKTAFASKDRAFDQLTKMIEREKRMAALIGSDAAPLAVEAWVNGDPLTDEGLKGKVVLLDFWAVWCGPCIATFPHLREWQEKYAEKGLVIIGLTNYYNYTWDEAAGRATRSPEKATPEQEQEMLRKFAESHDLHHRFAIQQDRSMAEFYGVSGIPHAVVVDREGKVILMKVGSGEENAKALEAAIVKAIGEGA
ncbi:MAG: redoxin family protein [Pirellulaceae bacterium]|nr:redoxin family protein [Pirellulaceae bacterium]